MSVRKVSIDDQGQGPKAKRLKVSVDPAAIQPAGQDNLLAPSDDSPPFLIPAGGYQRLVLESITLRYKVPDQDPDNASRIILHSSCAVR